MATERMRPLKLLHASSEVVTSRFAIDSMHLLLTTNDAANKLNHRILSTAGHHPWLSFN
jgi:hypothetical protein